MNLFAGSSIVSGHGVSGAQVSGQAGFPGTMTGLVGNQPAQGTDRPRAAINWIIFDEQFRYVSGGFDMVDADVNGTGAFKQHNTIPTVSIPRNGYIYVFCSNESKYNVFFDNLQLIHKRGPILEEMERSGIRRTTMRLTTRLDLLILMEWLQLNGLKMARAIIYTTRMLQRKAKHQPEVHT